MTEYRLIEKLDYALSIILGTENIDKIYNAKTENEIDDIIIDLMKKG